MMQKEMLQLFLAGCIAVYSSIGGASHSIGYAQENVRDSKDHIVAQSATTTLTKEATTKKNAAGCSVLDAGIGNPNWINTEARYAFIRLMDFALTETKRDFADGNMAGHAQLAGIGERFTQAMNPANATDLFLIRAVDYCVRNLGLDKDALVKELVDGIVGCYYPSPSRYLKNSEVIANAFLQSILYRDADLRNTTQLFATEGGSAAICYIFNALTHNKLLNPGDTIALATPIFSPYLEIPHINDYNLVSVNVDTEESNRWDIAEEDIRKLEDKKIKAFFIVNPSNPGAHALSAKTLALLKEVVQKNPDLIILTDDIYSTFTDDFQTIYSVVPYNTILVYSFSKLYGVTGWRTGIIALNKKNICDDLLAKLPAEHKRYIEKEYSSVTPNVSALPFIERMTADSRAIGLYHTSGLSTPSQVFMDLLALTHLTRKDKDTYIEASNKLVTKRYIALMSALGLPADTSGENSKYYALVDINKICENLYGKEFVAWKIKHISDLSFLQALAEKKGVILMYGPEFASPQGYVRVSLANLKENDYREIGKRVKELIGEYYREYCAHK